MYVVWLLVFWRNVLNVSNFYIKCKSILNKGGLFPHGVPFLGHSRHCLFNPWSNWQSSYIPAVHMATDLTSQSTAWGLLLPAQRKVADGRLLPSLCVCRKADILHYLAVVAQRLCHLLNDNSVSFCFTYNGCLFTHFTFSLTMATRGGSGTPALSPSVCAIGWICQHTTFWWCYK